MWWLVTIILIIISLLSSITLFYGLRRINQYEAFIVRIQQIINLSSNKMKQLDAKGSFEADDEIGFFFKEVQNIQDILDDLFETDTIEENKNADKKNSQKGS